MREATGYLNLFAAVLIAMPILTIVTQAGSGAKGNEHQRKWQAFVAREVAKSHLQPGKPLRDIYYIILDEHSRTDSLKRYFGYDNGGFVSHLRSKGFYVPPRSRSNYPSTYPSLSSSLNFDYIQSYFPVLGSHPHALDLGRMIEDSRVCHLLKSAGYKFVFFPSVFQVTCRNHNADVVVSGNGTYLSEFDQILVFNSVLQPFFSAPHVHRHFVQYALRHLEDVPNISGPKFVFAHFICPRPPYVFDARGNVPKQSSVTQHERDDWRLYIGQVAYIDKQIERVVETIIERSKVPPIIIVQGDHGPRCLPRYSDDGRGARHRVTTGQVFPILNAYYLPDGGEKLLYPSISPVNSFRVVLNHYFGAEYKLLSDKSYAIKWSGDHECESFERVR